MQQLILTTLVLVSISPVWAGNAPALQIRKISVPADLAAALPRGDSGCRQHFAVLSGPTKGTIQAKEGPNASYLTHVESVQSVPPQNNGGIIDGTVLAR